MVAPTISHARPAKLLFYQRIDYDDGWIVDLAGALAGPAIATTATCMPMFVRWRMPVCWRQPRPGCGLIMM
jgi:hypothetical protein